MVRLKLEAISSEVLKRISSEVLDFPCQLKLEAISSYRPSFRPFHLSCQSLVELELELAVELVVELAQGLAMGLAMELAMELALELEM